LGKIRTETIGAAEEWYVAELLATSPKFQRKGLASLLLRYGLEKADKEKRRTYIEVWLFVSETEDYGELLMMDRLHLQDIQCISSLDSRILGLWRWI
jgi:GNAT superfamily N-acetyltransferase